MPNPSPTQHHSARGKPKSRLLACGIAAAVLFNGLVLLQAFTRPGFDLIRPPLSLLALGEWGWVQTANFLVSGLLVAASAVGARQSLQPGIGRFSAPILIAIYGSGMVLAGIFISDPENGFPLGEHRPATLSWHAELHGLGFMVAHVAVVLACLVLAARFWRQGSLHWAVHSAMTAIAVPGIIMIGFANEPVRGLAFFSSGGIIALGWLAAICWKLGLASPDAPSAMSRR